MSKLSVVSKGMVVAFRLSILLYAQIHLIIEKKCGILLVKNFNTDLYGGNWRNASLPDVGDEYGEAPHAIAPDGRHHGGVVGVGDGRAARLTPNERSVDKESDGKNLCGGNRERR